MHTRQSLLNDLARAALLPNDTVIVHSSYKKIGTVSGGPETVIDALWDYFTKDGLLVFPTLTYTLFHDYDPQSETCKACLNSHPPGHCLAQIWKDRTPEFHANTTPACIGLLPNLFLKRQGVFRSLNPSHSVAAAGPDAKDFVSGHQFSPTPCGNNTPWRKLLRRGAKILHLGSPINSTTFMHACAEWLHPDIPTPLIPRQVHVFDHTERQIQTAIQHITAGSTECLQAMIPDLTRLGTLKHFQFGSAACLQLDCCQLWNFYSKHYK